VLAPILRTVPDVEDFGYVLVEAVHNDIGRGNQLAGVFAFPRPANGRKGLKFGYAVSRMVWATTRAISGSSLPSLAANCSSRAWVSGVKCTSVTLSA